jgi:DNA polymerase III sliding clamp (beta) subunit (PCNA family)
MQRTELFETLERISPGLASIDMIPILVHLWFNDTTVMAYNDYIAIEAKCKTGLKCAIPGQTLISMLRHSLAKTVDLSIANKEVLIKMGRSNLKLGMLPPEDFIFTMPRPAKGTELQIDFKRFRTVIECCMRSVSTDTSVPDQLGVTLILNGENLELYSTNNSTISTGKVPLKGKAPFKDRVVLSGDFCKQLLELTKTPGSPQIWVADDHTLLKNGDITLFGKLVEVDKPLPFTNMLSHHLPKNYKQQTIELPKQLKMVLMRAMVITDSPTEQTRTTITVKDGEMLLISKSGKGEIKDRIKVEGHPDVSVKLEPKLLSLGLDDFKNLLITDQCSIMSNGSQMYLVRCD